MNKIITILHYLKTSPQVFFQSSDLFFPLHVFRTQEQSTGSQKNTYKLFKTSFLVCNQTWRVRSDSVLTSRSETQSCLSSDSSCSLISCCLGEDCTLCSELLRLFLHKTSLHVHALFGPCSITNSCFVAMITQIDISLFTKCQTHQDNRTKHTQKN